MGRVDIVGLVDQLRGMAAKTGGRLRLDTPDGASFLTTDEVSSLLGAAEAGASEEGVARVAARVAPLLQDVSRDMSARTMLAIAPILARVRPMLERTREALDLAARMGGDGGNQDERLALHTLTRLADALTGTPLPPPPSVGFQADGSLLLAEGEIVEAIQDYLTARGYLGPAPKPGGYGPLDGPPVTLEIDPVTFTARARAKVRPAASRTVELDDPTGEQKRRERGELFERARMVRRRLGNWVGEKIGQLADSGENLDGLTKLGIPVTIADWNTLRDTLDACLFDDEG